MKICDKIISKIVSASEEKEYVTVAIDGRCASGKTTLAKQISDKIPCNVFHTDDFFLRPVQRTPERYAEPGGHFDRERFEKEILLQIKKGLPFSYLPFDCRTMTLSSPVSVTPKKISIIEGAYSAHPLLLNYYDLTVFLSVSEAEQRKRIEKRNPDFSDKFFNRWIPLEEKYISEYDMENKCDLFFE